MISTSHSRTSAADHCYQCVNNCALEPYAKPLVEGNEETTHSQHSRIRRNHPTFHAFLPIEQIPPSDLFQSRIRTPWSYWPFESAFHDIHEASFCNMSRHVLCNLERLVDATTAFDAVAGPIDQILQSAMGPIMSGSTARKAIEGEKTEHTTSPM